MVEQLPALVIVSLLTSAGVSRVIGRRHPAASVAVARITVGVALGASIVLVAASGGADTSSLFALDRLGTTIATFVAAMATIVGAFAGRSLAGDPRAPRSFSASNALVGSTIALALADRPWLMAASWLAVSAATVALIRFDGRPASNAAARRARRVFLIGDVAVVAGCVLASLSSARPAGSISAVAEGLAGSPWWLGVGVGAALVTGALVRSAQLPFSNWLASSVEAPTPVSALLHAGVVNGSAILLIRWHPLMSSSTVITVATIGIALGGVVAGMAIGRTRPDVKSGLAWTTVAQMGFMTLQCALGLAGVAVIHLMAHGMFKASLFLGTGSGLDGTGTHRHPTRTLPPPRLAALSAVGAALVVGAALAIVRPEFLHHPAAVVPVMFGWATVAYTLGQWWSRVEPRSVGALAAPLGLGVVGTGVLMAISSFVDHWLGQATAVVAPRGAAWLAAAAVAVVGSAWIAGVIVPRRFPTIAAKAWMLLAAHTMPFPLRRPAPANRPARVVAALTSAADHTRREQTRAMIGRAAGVVPASRPLEHFVAINPLAALEALPVEVAAVDAVTRWGVHIEWDEETFRALHRSGRISDADLRAALHDHLSAADHLSTVDGMDATAGSSVDELHHQLLADTPVQLPPTRPVLVSEWYDRAGGTRRAETVDAISSWWCAAYLGDHPAWPLPGRDNGLGAAWRSIAAHDPRLARLTGSVFADLLAGLPERDDDAVAHLLDALGVAPEDHESYLRRHLSRRHGWAGAIVAADGAEGDDLVGYLVIRLATEAALFADSAERAVARDAQASHPEANPSDVSRVWRLSVWQDAYERPFRDRVLSSTCFDAEGEGGRPSSQAVFCIDPRSEGLRRHLESVSTCETIGYAGFFGLAISVTDLDTAEAVPSCPIIVEPAASVLETDLSPNAGVRSQRVRIDHAAHDVFATVKRSAAGPFALAESFGWLSGPWMAGRTLAPQGTARLTTMLRGRWIPDPTTSLDLGPDGGWSAETKLATAESILRTTGLDRSPAPLVVLCGHGSHHVNNLHRAGLQCGACGGRAGGNNARVAARLLNDPEIRSDLHSRGISVPDDTWFVAAEHDTTADVVRILDRDTIPESHLGALTEFEADMAEACDRLACERGAHLPRTVGRSVGPDAATVRRRGTDWAQVVPENGLADNAAVVIGPRALTTGADLQRRVFLHSYRAEYDPDGQSLAAIMAGPVAVAHGINAQYRMSTVDPERLGAGTKTAHNLVGGVGVIEGAGGDLRIGLPRESVASADAALHEPMRLLVVVDAPTHVVDHALGSAPAIARLADNGWISVAARPSTATPDATPDATPTATSDATADATAVGAGWTIRRCDSSWTPWSPGGGADPPATVDAVAELSRPEPVPA